MTGPLLSKTVSIHALSPQSYNCNLKDTITGGFLWIYMSKHFFHCFISRKYAFADVLQNRYSRKFRKIHRESPLPDSLDSGTDIFLIIFWKFYEQLFYRTPLNGCFWFQFHLYTVLRLFWFRTEQYLFNIPSYFGYFKIHGPWPTGPPYFFCIK